MARALYRSWFVDFDPVHAKREGRAPAHMDAQTASLFPDSFGDDGLPDGWKMEPLAAHIAVLRGLSYKGTGLCGADEGVPLHNLNSVFEGGGYKTTGIKYYQGDFKPRHEIVPGDLIVTNTEQGFDLLLMGHAALVPHHFGPTGLFSHHIYKLEPNARSLSREWLYLLLSVSPSNYSGTLAPINWSRYSIFINNLLIYKSVQQQVLKLFFHDTINIQVPG